MQGRQNGDIKVVRRRKYKGKYENPYVAQRINEIRLVDAMYVDETEEYPKELKSVRWKRFWDAACDGKTNLEINTLRQCEECGDVFHRSEFRPHRKRAPLHTVCRACRPRVSSRLKWRRQAAKKRAIEEAALKRMKGNVENERKRLISIARQQWNERTANNRTLLKKRATQMQTTTVSGRVTKSYVQRTKLLEYHMAVRKAMEADHNNPDKHIVNAQWYFDDDELRAKWGIAPHERNQMTDHVTQVIPDS